MARLELGAAAPSFELPEPLTGRVWSLEDDFKGSQALLVMFLCNHCPYVVHLKEAIAKLTEEYIQKGVATVGISSNSVLTHPEDGPEFMAEDAKKYNYKFPYLYDEKQDVAKAYGAACTPDFFLFKKSEDKGFELAYHGRFDPSRPRSNIPVTGSDLQAAMECVLGGKPLPEQFNSVGCSIKWHPQS